MTDLSDLSISVSSGDALALDCDVLALKHAQSLYGLDRHVVDALEAEHPSIRAELPPPSGFRIYKSDRDTGPREFLFVGVVSLRSFLYDEIREFGARVLTALASRNHDIRSLGLTLHGPGYGLDERDCFEALLAGLAQALQSGDHPPGLERVKIAEVNQGRAERMTHYLSEYLSADRASRSAGATSARSTRETVFVAIPFNDKFIDTYFFGIQAPLHELNLKVERMDELAFTGDVVTEMRGRIQRARFMVADLTDSNPNVHLEVGFAWGSGVDTIFVTRDIEALEFDTQGYRCLQYGSAKELSGKLKREVLELLSDAAAK